MNRGLGLAAIEDVPEAIDAFEQVLGNGRGVGDARELSVRLARAERQLAAVHGELRTVTSERDELDKLTETLADEVEELESELAWQRYSVARLRRDRDVIRYSAVLPGCRTYSSASPAINRGTRAEGRIWRSRTCGTRRGTAGRRTATRCRPGNGPGAVASGDGAPPGRIVRPPSPCRRASALP